MAENVDLDQLLADEFPPADEYEEEEIIEEVSDDQPMRVWQDKLFLGSIDAAQNVAALKSNNIKNVVSILSAAESQQFNLGTIYSQNHINHHTIIMEDSLQADLFLEIPHCLHLLRKCINNCANDEQRVLVHCIAGVSRSASIVIAWLMAIDSSNVSDSIDRLMLVRPWVSPNPNFMKHLHHFHDVLQAKLPFSDVSFLNSLSLPRIDFDSSFLSPIVNNNKIGTLRMATDIDNDENSDLSSVFLHSTCFATFHSNSKESAVLIRIDDIKYCTFGTLEDEEVKTKEKVTKKELKNILLQYYPKVDDSSKVIFYTFFYLGGGI